MLTNNWFSRYTQNDYTSHDKGYYHRILEYSSRVQVSIIFVRINSQYNKYSVKCNSLFLSKPD